MHQAKNAGRGLQPRPKRLFSGVGKYFGRGCKPRPADHGLIKTMSYDLSLMHMGRNPAFSGGEVPLFLQDGVCNPVRNIFRIAARKRFGRGCKPICIRLRLQPTVFINSDFAGRGLQPRPEYFPDRRPQTFRTGLQTHMHQAKITTYCFY
ncbi:Uncharacterized protein dnm_003800 [Desulfonema magnum]|uniref:Uncharacterized protein n=1 Tax=Desulfonema magnum TaxID=45655 RepID=A0A975GK67_9BACT|nr:Uncharacterized protein dnm_003800 [Desulfonema magnum]